LKIENQSVIEIFQARSDLFFSSKVWLKIENQSLIEIL